MSKASDLALSTLILALSVASPASAEPEPKPALEIPDATDTVSASLQLDPSLAWSDIWGDLSHARRVTQSVSAGPSIGLDAAYGLSRTVQLGIWGRLDDYSTSSSCGACSGQSFALGPSFTYRLAQGTRLDPWAAIGIGYSFTSIHTADAKLKFSGPEWARLALGADWYVGSQVLIGPFAELMLGTNAQVPSGDDSGGPHFRVAAGLRLGFASNARR